MKKKVAEGSDSEDQSQEDLRQELYEQFDVSTFDKLVIAFILPLLDVVVQTESRYNINTRPKILAEIALSQAYQKEPKFKIFAWATVILLTFDSLHTLNPEVYGILFIALATLNGFVSSLRSPAMMAAELEELKDKDGMPANYRAKALSSVNTNVTILLFIIAVGIQLLVTSSIVPTELVTLNVAEGVLNPIISAIILALLPVLTRIR